MISSIKKFAGRSLIKRFFSSPCNGLLISAKDARVKLNQPKVKFIDIRDPRFYNQGHIPGSINMIEFFSYLAMSTPNGVRHLQKTFTKLLREKDINGDEEIITYEGMMRGQNGASCRAWYLLNLLGHSNVRVLDGGWDAWIAEDNPVSVEKEHVSNKGSFEVDWNGSEWANLNDVRTLIQNESNVKLLDVRDVVEWTGASSSPYGANFAPRKGRLPKAIHLEWYDLMTLDENKITYFKSPEEIRTIAKEKGITPDDDIVVYCFKGSRAANTMMALKTAGFNNLKNYFGSWNEWSRFRDLIIDDEKLEELEQKSLVQ